MRLHLGKGWLPIVASFSFLVATGYAQETWCSPGQEPRYGFEALHDRLGDRMGNPLTCGFPDPNGTGDVHQVTSQGLGFWRKRTNTPTFTNDHEHWALTERGFVSWLGKSIDPPADAVPAAGAVTPLLPRHRLVAHYGNPLAAVLGILGEPRPRRCWPSSARRPMPTRRAIPVGPCSRRSSSSRCWPRSIPGPVGCTAPACLLR